MGNEKQSETLCHAPPALGSRSSEAHASAQSRNAERPAPCGLGKDARGLTSEEQLDFLCDRSQKFKQSAFIWYGGGYDVCEMLRDLPFEVAWEIQNQMAFRNHALTEDKRDDPDIGRPVVWLLKDEKGKPRKAFVINYLKGKWFQVGRLRNPDPACWYKRAKSTETDEQYEARVAQCAARGWGKPARKLGRSKGFDYDGNGQSMRIDDVAGYFQCPFLEAMEGMKSSITIAPEEQALIEWGKPLRDAFANEPMEKIIAYNQAELNICSKMMDAFREVLSKYGINPNRWHGPGVIAKEVLKIKGIAPQPKTKGVRPPHHFPEFLTASHNITEAQKWAHHAFSGGHIDLMRQGVHQGGQSIFEYDLCSAYPAEIVNLPSMHGGKYLARKSQPKMTLQEIKALIEPMNMLSMIEVHWDFQYERRELSSKKMLTIAEGCYRPDGSFDEDLLCAKVEEAKGEPLPYYPFFYRVNGEPASLTTMIDTTAGKGAVLYPPSGKGRYYRAEVLAAIAWCERFPHAVRKFEFHGAQEFIAGEDVKGIKPFAFIQEMFDERSRIVADTAAKKKIWKAGGELGPEPYDIREKALKLIMNSIYGKMAQSIGTRGKLPNCTNPFYAGAITAGTRAKLLLASLDNPHGIIFFATDAITSIGPLEGQKTVQEKVLGKWEHAADIDVVKGAAFVHPGIYSFFDLKGNATLKMRGCKVDFGRDFMMKQVRANFKRGDRPHLVTGKPANVIYLENKSLVTLGLAVSSPENWKKCGTWKTQKRELDLNKVGTKRMKCNNKLRANELVFVPAMENYESGLSAPYYPEWLQSTNQKTDREEREATELTVNQIGETELTVNQRGEVEF